MKRKVGESNEESERGGPRLGLGRSGEMWGDVGRCGDVWGRKTNIGYGAAEGGLWNGVLGSEEAIHDARVVRRQSRACFLNV